MSIDQTGIMKIVTTSHREYSLHVFPTATGERKIYVPASDKWIQEKETVVPEKDQIVQAKQLFELILAAQKCYGVEDLVISGLLSEVEPANNMWHASSTFKNTMMYSAERKLVKSLTRQGLAGIEVLDKEFRRKRWGEEIFELQADKSIARIFENKTSPLRDSAKRINSEWVSIFDATSKYTLSWAENNFSFVEMTQILDETFLHAEKTLKARGVEVTDANIIAFIQLASLKKSRVLLPVFENMGFLKPSRYSDENIAYMVGLNIKYEHLLAFAVSGLYPKTIDELATFISLPYEWLVKALF